MVQLPCTFFPLMCHSLCLSVRHTLHAVTHPSLHWPTLITKPICGCCCSASLLSHHLFRGWTWFVDINHAPDLMLRIETRKVHVQIQYPLLLIPIFGKWQHLNKSPVSPCVTGRLCGTAARWSPFTPLFCFVLFCFASLFVCFFN